MIQKSSQEIALDLHIHSYYSHDGMLDTESIVAIAKQKGLGGIAITDHNTIRGGEEAKRYEEEGFIVIIGAEIMTEKGEITGLFLSREIRSRYLQEVINEIKTQGGIVVVPHPFDKLRRSRFNITSEYSNLVDAVEGFNSRCIFQQYNNKAIEFAREHSLSIIGGSDAHYANEIGLAGIITSSKDIRKSILQANLRLFGRRSSLLNHVRTKIRKQFRKTFK